MKTLFSLACLVIICCNAWSQTKPDQDAMMKAWMSYMTPGDVHKQLAMDDGSWTQELTMWMGPDAPAEKSTAKATNRMIYGGRYQESTTVGSFNGMPFEGKSTVGYDNAMKIYQSTWVDNMGTGIMYMEGTPSKDGKTVNFRGKSVDPMTGKTIDVREVFTVIDNDTRKMEMYMTPVGGKEYKSMEIIMKRDK